MAAGPQPSIEVHGAAKAAVDLRQMGERSSDIRRVSEKVRSVYRKSNERRFDSAGYGSWPPLDPETSRQKADAGQDPRPLRATGALYKALTAPRARGQIDRRDRDEFRFGTDLRYSVFQAPRGRDPMQLLDSEKHEISRLIGDYIASNRA